MTDTKRPFALAAAASALLCLAMPHAQAAGPLFTTGSPVMASGSTLITFSDGKSRSMAPQAVSQSDALPGAADAPAPVTSLTADLSSARGVPHYNGLPSPPKLSDVPEPSETATLSLGGVMLTGLALLARKRRTARVS